jgi:hypothetical protein
MYVDKMETIESVILCKLNREEIGELPVSSVVSIERYLDEIPKMVLKVKKYIVSQSGKKKVINPVYDDIKNKRYILLNENEYFIIEKINENKLSNVKEVTCYKGEYKLNKMAIEMKEFFLSIMSTDIENNIYALNDLLKEIGWSIDYVDDAVRYDGEEDKIRWQENVDDNWLDFVKNDIAVQFNCYPVFNTMDKTISLYDMDTLGEEIKICLSFDNYIKSKVKEVSSDDLITLLKLKGNEELNIGYYVPTGYDFITDFSYFIDTREMSDELISALAKYDEMVAIRTVQWRALVDERAAKQSELDINRSRWQMSISTIEGYKNQISIYRLKKDTINEGRVTVALAKEKDNELLLRLKIEELIKDIELLNESIININILCKYETCTDENGNLVFNRNLLNELGEFIFCDTFNDSSYVDANQMIEYGKGLLSKRCKPTLEVDIDSMNFINKIIDNGFRQHWNGELSFGDIVVLMDEENDTEEYYYFIGYSVDYENNKLILKISNKKSNRKETKTINQWLKQAKSMNALLSTNEYLFNKVKSNRLNIDKNQVQ